MPHPQGCPDESTLWRFLQDQLSGEDAERIDDHIGGCPACQGALDLLVGSLPGRGARIPMGRTGRSRTIPTPCFLQSVPRRSADTG
jgi:hypothetical protein